MHDSIGPLCGTFIVGTFVFGPPVEGSGEWQSDDGAQCIDVKSHAYKCARMLPFFLFREAFGEDVSRHVRGRGILEGDATSIAHLFQPCHGHPMGTPNVPHGGVASRTDTRDERSVILMEQQRGASCDTRLVIRRAMVTSLRKERSQQRIPEFERW